MLPNEQRREDQQRADMRVNARKIMKFGLFPSVAVFAISLLLINTGVVEIGMWFLPVVLIVGGLGFVVVTLENLARSGRLSPVERRHLAGTTVRQLDGPDGADGVPIGDARLQETAARTHTLIEGATGTGKTQLLKQMMDYIRAQGDTVVVVDTGWDMHQTFGRPDDLVLSIFDEQSPGWMPQHEVQNPADWKALAQSLIGNGEGDGKQWADMAKAMFASVARGYQKAMSDADLEFDPAEFFHLLTAGSVEELQPYLVGSAAASLADNEKGLANVRMSFFESLGFWEDLKPGDFSIRDWVNLPPAQRPSIFIPHTKRTLPAAKNVISCWLDQLITEAADAGPSDQKVWVIIDELSSLGSIPSLEAAVTELRKTGFRVVCGIQNFEQIEARYGKHSAVTITNNLSNKVMFRATSGDAAERQSKTIGDARNRVTTHGSSRGTGSDGKSTSSSSISTSDVVDRVVLASQISGLPDLHAYVKFSGSDEVLVTTIPIYGKETK
jgi:hypothetical protein